MQCEICGRDFPKLMLIEIEGCKLMACSDCSRGAKVLEDDVARIEEKNEARLQVVRKKSKVFSPSRKDFDLGLDIVEDYGDRVKRAREKMNITREELGQKIFEKASVIEKIERNAFRPSDDLIAKLENFLGISLREQRDEPEAKLFFSTPTENDKMTLEHFIKKKKQIN